MTLSIHEGPSGKDNPFSASSVVVNKNFTGREEELSKLLNFIEANTNVLIRAAKGMGKTSLIAEFARRHSRDFEFIYIDTYGMTSQTQLLETMVTGAMGSYRSRDGTLDQGGWEILGSTRLRLAVLRKGSLATSAHEDVQTLAPPTKKDIEIANKAQKKIEIRMCPDCGRPLKWIEKYARHYCYGCKKYLPRQRRMRSESLDPSANLDKTCPTCGQETSFDEKYSHYYCSKCRRYPFVHLKMRDIEEFKTSEITEVLDLSQKIAEQMDKQVIMIFDEFQDIASFGSKELLRAMRSKFESHTDVSYVFAGGDDDTIHNFFENHDGPFYKFSDTIELGPIPAEEMEKFLMARFRSADGKLRPESARRIVSLSGGFPAHAQLIAHELLHISKEPSQDDLEKAIRSVVREQSRVYESIWGMIHSPLQRRYLMAIVTEPRMPHGADFIKRNDLNSRSHVQRCETQLDAKGIIRDGEVVDPMFVLWLRSLTNQI